MKKKIPDVVIGFQKFIQSEQSSGIVLIVSTIVSLFIANSPLAGTWFDFWDTEIGIKKIHLEKSLLHWVNDGLMAIFFLLVGLEIKREIIEGELSSVKKSFLPIAAAVGGMVVPALIYTLVNFGKASSSGWGIPMATDIAFALGVLTLLGNRVPFSLKIMLAALAIVDDLGAIIVIAVFYSSEISLNYIIFAGITLVFLIVLNKLKVKWLFVYLVIGVFLWYFTLKSGIHATISGVLLAMALPLGKGKTDSAAENLQHILEKPVGYIIMPLFALSNTGFLFQTRFSEIIQSPVSIGIVLGLFIGKPVGIFLFSWASIKLGFSNMPKGATWRYLAGIGFLGGIGFTMSIFISLLAFEDPDLIIFSKVAILLASVTSGLVGYLIILSTSRKKKIIKPFD
jgi:Na+:H+ antiporter, NhaA family